MRELERDLPTTDIVPSTELPAIAIVGARARWAARSPRPRSAPGSRSRSPIATDALPHAARHEAVLLCVPDAAIADAAERRGGSGTATRLRRPRQRRHRARRARAARRVAGAATFSLHPLQTVPTARPISAARRARSRAPTPPPSSSPRALGERLGMRPFEVADERPRRLPRRSVASPPTSSSRSRSRRPSCSRRAGVEDARELLAPLVLRTAANWAERGAEALTGPIARGDEATVERHRAALREIGARPAHPLRSAGRAHAGDRRGAAMRVARTKAELRDALAAPRREGRSDRPRADDGRAPRGPPLAARALRAERCDVVVMSLFVNPAQFGPGEDLDRYPRDEARDLALAEAEGVDFVYAPSVDGGLPAGLRHRRRGRRRAHRRPRRRPAPAAAPSTSAASTTVVAKLFNAVEPDVAFFGQKDAQQAVVIERMAARSRLSRRDRGAAHGARARRPRAELAQRLSR